MAQTQVREQIETAPRWPVIKKRMIDHLMAHAVFIVFLGTFISGLGAYLASKSQDIESKKISSLNQETLNRITSKESYCYMRIIPKNLTGSNDEENKATIYLFHSGKYPIKNVRISLVNTDQDAEEEPALAATYTKNPEVYYKPNYPYTEVIPLLLPNQRLQLKDLPIVRRKQKCFNVAYSDENNIWYQRILLRNAPEYGMEHDANIEDFRAQTEVYTLDLDPKLNQIYRHEIIMKHGPYGQYMLDADKKNYFPVGSRINVAWISLHWNGNHLDKDDRSIAGMFRDYKLDTPLRSW